MRQNSLRDDLRDATRAVHESLHKHPDFEALATGRLSQQAHRVLMCRLGGFHTALDPLMQNGCDVFADQIGDYRYVPRAPLFSQIALDGPSLDTPRDAAALAGMAYVTDGSVLGGTLLSRASEDQPHPYWAFCAREGARIWHRTRLLIDHVDTGPVARTSAISKAEEVFACFQRWVEPSLQDAA